jgi:hypothetical protein
MAIGFLAGRAGLWHQGLEHQLPSGARPTLARAVFSTSRVSSWRGVPPGSNTRSHVRPAPPLLKPNVVPSGS